MLATSVVDDAEVALARAHSAAGEKLAPYETTLADLYLIKAKEEQGHAHYSEARDLAADALQLAETATRKAAERRTSADAPPMPTATVQHPNVAPAAPPGAAEPDPAAPRTVLRPGQAPPDASPPPAQTPPPGSPPPPPERKPKAPIDPGNQQ